MSFKKHYLLWLLLWAAAAFGILMLDSLPEEFDCAHALCGPWG